MTFKHFRLADTLMKELFWLMKIIKLLNILANIDTGSL